MSFADFYSNTTPYDMSILLWAGNLGMACWLWTSATGSASIVHGKSGVLLHLVHGSRLWKSINQLLAELELNFSIIFPDIFFHHVSTFIIHYTITPPNPSLQRAPAIWASFARIQHKIRQWLSVGGSPESWPRRRAPRPPGGSTPGRRGRTRPGGSNIVQYQYSRIQHNTI